MVLFFISFVLIVSCLTETDKKPSIVHPIIGSWKWIESFGGWGQHLTPESVGYEKTVIFQSDHTYKELHNSEEFKVSEFNIENKRTWGNGSPIEDILVIDGYDIEQIIDFQNNDTLHLTDIYYNCGEHYYFKIENN